MIKNFSLAIPTYNRENDLEEVLNSILNQSVLPDEILIIDDGDLDNLFIKKFQELFKTKNVKFIYYKKDHSKERRGLSESKNIALNKAKHGIIFIIDDDVVVPRNAFEFILNLWEKFGNDCRLLGIGVVGEGYRRKSKLERVFNKFFGLTGECVWDVNNVGFQCWDDHIEYLQRGYYMHGFFSSFKKNLILELGGFELFKGGRTALEDVELGLRIKKRGYYFLITPSIKIIHKISNKSREKDFLIGFKESQNRKIIFKKHCQQDIFHKIWFIWANVGWILRQFLVGHFKKGWGMIVGFLKSIN